MTIAPVTTAGASSLYTTATTTAPPKQDLDKEVFLNLLVAQLRNQDPSSPMDTTQMMAQSSQLASMEQLTGLADTTRDQFGLQMRMAAATFVGQEVSFLDPNGVARTGVVTGATFEAAVPSIKVGSWTVPLDSISAINRPAGSPAPVPAPVAPPAPASPAPASTSPTTGSAPTA